MWGAGGSVAVQRRRRSQNTNPPQIGCKFDVGRGGARPGRGTQSIGDGSSGRTLSNGIERISELRVEKIYGASAQNGHRAGPLSAPVKTELVFVLFDVDPVALDLSK